MKNNGGRMRMKILLIILGIVLIAFGVVFYYYGPYSEAARGGIKGKPKKTPKSSPTETLTPTSSPTETATATPSTTLFSDDFSGDLSQWQIVYYTASIQSDELNLIPQDQTYNSPSDTHAPLIVAGDTAWKDYVYQVKMKTARQLRPSNPNPWEVGWLIFRYVDTSHFYYFIHKPNGIELGKVDPSGQGGQIFLYTAETPKLTIGQYYDYKVTLKGNNIKVAINGTQVVDYTDTNNPYLVGKIGLYNEDAETLNDDVLVTSN